MNIQEKINSLDSVKFLEIIGIKKSKINIFMDNINGLNLDISNFQVFRLYLKHSDKEKNIIANSVKEEIMAFRELGFTSKHAKYYVDSIRDVFKQDSTINWAYRIIESLLFEKCFENYCKFLFDCHISNKDISKSPTDDDDDDDDDYDDDDNDGDYVDDGNEEGIKGFFIFPFIPPEKE